MSERQSTRMFTRMKSKKGDERMSGREASPLAGKTRRSYFRSSLSTSSMGGCSESSKPSEEDAEDSERDRRETAAAATVSLKGVLDFPDVVRKLDGEANEGERHVQLGLAKFMAVLDDAPAKDVLAAMERQWGMDRPGALFSLAGGAARLKKSSRASPRTAPHAPTWKLRGSRSLLVSPEQSLSHLQVRSGLGSSPWPPPTAADSRTLPPPPRGVTNLAGGVTNLKLHTVLAQARSRRDLPASLRTLHRLLAPSRLSPAPHPARTPPGTPPELL